MFGPSGKITARLVSIYPSPQREKGRKRVQLVGLRCPHQTTIYLYIAIMPEVTIELRTAPRDRRFPTTNQTKHCWARYLEFHACSKVKGKDDPECAKFKRYYNSLCPLEWVSTLIVFLHPFLFLFPLLLLLF